MTNEHKTATKTKPETIIVTLAEIRQRAKSYGIEPQTQNIIDAHAARYPYDEKAGGFVLPRELPPEPKS